MTQKAHDHAVDGVLPSAGGSELNRMSVVSAILDGYLEIPGTRYKIGLDPVLGFVPGIGDALSAFLSLYVIYLGAKAGLPKRALVRMVANVLIDTALGAVPVIGDLFDFVWRSNTRNIEIAKSYLSSGAQLPVRSAREISRLAGITVVTLGVLLVVGVVLSVFALLRLLLAS